MPAYTIFMETSVKTNSDLWEFCIYYSRNFVATFEEMKKKYKDILSGNAGVCANFNREEKHIFLIASGRDIQPKIIKNLKEDLSKIIYEYFKKQYLISNLNNLSFLKENREIFLQTLLVFDRQTDLREIESRLLLESILYLTEFYKFSLKNLQKKWREICDLTNDNTQFFSSKELLFELMRFLLLNEKRGGEKVVIDLQENQIILYGEEEKIIEKLNCSDIREKESEILAKIIDILPKKIEIKNAGGFSKTFVRNLCDLFLDSVSILS